MVTDSNITDQAKTFLRLKSEYEKLLETFSKSLCGRWQVRDSTAGRFRWRYFISPVGVSAQGWKIHVSAATSEAVRLIDEIMPYLVEQSASFKLPATLEDVILLNSGSDARTQVGKTLTVYVADDMACRSICSG